MSHQSGRGVTLQASCDIHKSPAFPVDHRKDNHGWIVRLALIIMWALEASLLKDQKWLHYSITPREAVWLVFNLALEGHYTTSAYIQPRCVLKPKWVNSLL